MPEDNLKDEYLPEELKELEQFKDKPSEKDEPSKDSAIKDNTGDELQKPSTGDELPADKPEPQPEIASSDDVKDLLSKVSPKDEEAEAKAKEARRQEYREDRIRKGFHEAIDLKTQSELQDYLDTLPNWIRNGVDGIPGVEERLLGKKKAEPVELEEKPEVATEDVIDQRIEAKMHRQKFQEEFQVLASHIAGQVTREDFQKFGQAVEQVSKQYPALTKNAKDLVEFAITRSGIGIKQGDEPTRKGFTMGGRPVQESIPGTSPSKDPNDLSEEEIRNMSDEDFDKAAKLATARAKVRSPWSNR